MKRLCSFTLLFVLHPSIVTADSRRVEGPVEIVTLEGEPELDPQRFALGGGFGLGWMTARSSGVGEPLINFALMFDVGLGTGGIRTPWTLEPYAAFALTRSTLTSNRSGGDPTRFTEIGVRLLWTPESLAGHWLSAGAGVVFSSWGNGTERGELTPAGLLDLGFGIYESISRRSRWGIAARAPIQLSAHPGIALMASMYLSLGVGR